MKMQLENVFKMGPNYIEKDFESSLKDDARTR